jgi:RNA polymerase sigma factor (sigma-70 family)
MAWGILSMRLDDALGADGAGDAELVAQARAGDADAFEALVLRYQPLADAYARHLLDHGPAAEDMVQESFLRAFRALSSLEQPERFGSWLKSIVWRQCRDWVRRQRAVRSEPAEALAAAPADAGDAAWEDTGEDPWLSRLEAAIEGMSDGNRVALALFYVLDVPIEHIARFLDVPLGTVKRRLFDGRATLSAAASGEPLDLPQRRRFVAELKRLLSAYAPDGGLP